MVLFAVCQSYAKASLRYSVTLLILKLHSFNYFFDSCPSSIILFIKFFRICPCVKPALTICSTFSGIPRRIWAKRPVTRWFSWPGRQFASTTNKSRIGSGAFAWSPAPSCNWRVSCPRRKSASVWNRRASKRAPCWLAGSVSKILTLWAMQSAQVLSTEWSAAFCLLLSMAVNRA